jgi:hypothetical protein
MEEDVMVKGEYMDGDGLEEHTYGECKGDVITKARKEDLPFQRTKWRLAGRGVF